MFPLGDRPVAPLLANREAGKGSHAKACLRGHCEGGGEHRVGLGDDEYKLLLGWDCRHGPGRVRPSLRPAKRVFEGRIPPFEEAEEGTGYRHHQTHAVCIQDVSVASLAATQLADEVIGFTWGQVAWGELVGCHPVVKDRQRALVDQPRML